MTKRDRISQIINDMGYIAYTLPNRSNAILAARELLIARRAAPLRDHCEEEAQRVKFALWSQGIKVDVTQRGTYDFYVEWQDDHE